MAQLGRVNLLVGTNNCGKTSVLEAIELLSAPGTAMPLWQSLARRGELREDGREAEVEVEHIVHGHAIDTESRVEIEGEDDAGDVGVVVTFPERSQDYKLPAGILRRQRELFAAEGDDEQATWAQDILLAWRGPRPGEHRQLRWPLTRRGGIWQELLSTEPRPKEQESRPVRFITTEGLTRETVVALFDEAVLTPDEATILHALRTIEPHIERIATVGSSRPSRARRGGIVMLVDRKRVPIGSMGDGLWRILGIAVALVRASNGTLLIDEIDTGLHFTVLVDMWRLVFETAARLNVQVFATTHSRDCYEALAAIAAEGSDDISLQRIERGRIDAVAFSATEIRKAAERGLEVR